MERTMLETVEQMLAAGRAIETDDDFYGLPWKMRLWLSSQGRPGLHAILSAMMMEQPCWCYDEQLAYFSEQLTVTSDAHMLGTFVDSEGETHLGAYICAEDELLEHITGISQHCRMTLEERGEAFALFSRSVHAYDPRFENKLRSALGVQNESQSTH